jgi:hypothetical protein
MNPKVQRDRRSLRCMKTTHQKIYRNDLSKLAPDESNGHGPCGVHGDSISRFLPLLRKLGAVLYMALPSG